MAKQFNWTIVERKPRDFYDCYFILRKKIISPKHQHLLQAAREVLVDTKINFKTELKDFLPSPQQVIISDFRQTLWIELDRW